MHEHSIQIALVRMKKRDTEKKKPTINYRNLKTRIKVAFRGGGSQ